jgi:hypothetical protein
MKLAAMPSTRVHCDLAGDRGSLICGLARVSPASVSMASIAFAFVFESVFLQRSVFSHRPGRCRPRTAAFVGVCAARLAARSAETRRPEQYRAKE